MDGAMRAWMRGLTSMKQQQQIQVKLVSVLANTLQGRLHANLVWGHWKLPRFGGWMTPKKHPSLLEKRSRPMKRIYNNSSSTNQQEGFGRVLALLATCYHKNGQAFMAEGLLQTAMAADDEALAIMGPQQLIDH